MSTVLRDGWETLTQLQKNWITRAGMFAGMSLLVLVAAVGFRTFVTFSHPYKIDRSRDFIENFDAELLFAADLSEMTVVESIAVSVHGHDRVQKGIFRTLLLNEALPFSAITLQGATQDGVPLAGTFVPNPKTGRPSIKLYDDRFRLNPGTTKYRLVYLVSRPLAWSADLSSARVVWNVTSPTTALPLAKGSVRVALPNGYRVSRGYQGWTNSQKFTQLAENWPEIQEYSSLKPLFFHKVDAPGDGFYWQVGLEIRRDVGVGEKAK